ncbi:DUF2029 domain-containing protein [Frankia sp. CNm7]|uniref:DUF2029 domain-containing protein n=1 Tax=Frankia nepalensis TaxID=1836974 RepID=A0A937RMZ1_9ACTN|nr:glycosyltransferase 87 family protein [Frankia nepalensis]MBL7495133.1 DUF2029 domain-containing protein [Frankia nepalensis]MBL7514567.1 DUF2029 domain-containing protein [Frankia nepalensis]MBL7523131.1 DUF2029 domain-containing protein [Frankia nepalensis]MBL7633052.1 DUF2029 domain-containing protein [Frankia nepalensis]
MRDGDVTVTEAPAAPAAGELGAQDAAAAVSPSREDPVVRATSELVGGPPGRHAALPDRRSWWTPLRILLALTILASGLGYAQKATCRDTRNWAHEYQYTRMCYSDVVALYSQEGLSGGKVPFLDYPTEYPPLIGLTMEVVAEVAGLAPAQRPVYREENNQQVLDHWTIDSRSALFYDLTAVLFLCLACLTVVLTARAAGRRRPWDAALFALAPVLVLHLLTNWDMVAVALAAAAVYAWSRRAPVAAGVLLGLGVATKLYPALFLVALGVLCLRTGQVRAFARTLAATAATVVAVLLPTWLLAGYFNDQHEKVSDGILPTFWSGGDWVALLDGNVDGARNAVTRFFVLNQERPADWDSLAFGLQWLAGAYDPGWFGGVHLAVMLLAALALGGAVYWLSRGPRWERWPTPLYAGAAASGAWLLIALGWPPLLTAVREKGIPLKTLNSVTAVALIAAIAGIAALCWFAPRRPRLPQVLFLLVVAFLVTNKVYSPQYSLWLLPLYALARPRWRIFLVWQVAEAYVLFTRFMHFIYNDTNGGRGMGRGWFVGAVTLRDLVLLVIAALVVREILRPELDAVRAVGLDDPAGGPLDGAPDVHDQRRLGWPPRLAPRPAADAGERAVALAGGADETRPDRDPGSPHELGALFRPRGGGPNPGDTGGITVGLPADEPGDAGEEPPDRDAGGSARLGALFRRRPDPADQANEAGDANPDADESRPGSLFRPRRRGHEPK